MLFLLQHLDEDVQKLDSQIQGVITEGDKISQQLEDSDPSESLRIQAEVEHLKVGYLERLHQETLLLSRCEEQQSCSMCFKVIHFKLDFLQLFLFKNMFNQKKLSCYM